MSALRALLHKAQSCLGADSWPRLLCRMLLLLAVLGLGGLLFVSAGLMPVAASAGHWPITRALLQFTMMRSVATHASGIEAPALDDPAMVLKGAGHYAAGCLPCHGGPGIARSEIVAHMVPEPPELTSAAGSLSPENMFWIIKHGIKYTAMPAWIAQQRDDEVWSMVAFLQRLPKLEPEAFRQLAYGDHAELAQNVGLATLVPRPQASLPGDCVRCHGSNGAGRGNAAFPRLAGQSEAYLRTSLQAFSRGERHSGVMQPIAAALDPRAIARLARYYAGLEDVDIITDSEQNPASIARGARLATHGVAERRIPACHACHGPGNADRNPNYPELAGQYAGYLSLQLRLFQRDVRGGTAYAPVMATVANSLSERDIRDLANYYASLSPRSETADNSGRR